MHSWHGHNMPFPPDTSKREKMRWTAHRLAGSYSAILTVHPTLDHTQMEQEGVDLWLDLLDWLDERDRMKTEKSAPKED